MLHENHSTPIVAVSVMYHVGAKNEQPNRTGFAHFFEHLLFEGSENIKRGEFLNLLKTLEEKIMQTQPMTERFIMSASFKSVGIRTLVRIRKIITC